MTQATIKLMKLIITVMLLVSLHQNLSFGFPEENLPVTSSALYTEKPVAKQGLKARLIRVQKIWDQGKHNAFTDLIRYKGNWICVFREGAGHVSPDGGLRIIGSKDAKKWESYAFVQQAKGDLRDAKITINADNQLMLFGASALHQPAAMKHQSMFWTSDNGKKWSKAINVGDPNFWLWRVTFKGKEAYGIAYQTSGGRSVRLYKSTDGKLFKTYVKDLGIKNYPNESSILFLKDGSALCLLRRDPHKGMIGRSKPPYKDWNWKELNKRIGGPHMIQIPGGEIITATRFYDGKVRTGISRLDIKNNKLDELVTLPSGGDTSYPGLVWHEGKLYVSYYSSHEGKTSIYLAVVEVER